MSGPAAPTLGPCPHCGQTHAEDVLVCPKESKVLPLEGRLLDGKFRFAKLLGAGGMGAVWRAQNIRVRKAVAIKLMHPEFAGNPGILDRFRNEATAAGQIGSQHICDIYDFGGSVLGPYIVLEMLNGRSFGELIQQYGRVDPGLAAIVMRQALVGLEAAHQVGIIHRDLKPENVFLHEPTPGRLLVKLMDFGISKFSQNAGNDGKTGVGVLMGTPEYMSPEQAEGAASADQRTDIWAMGAILYKALTGVEAFGGATMAATLVALATKEPKPIESYAPQTPPEMVAVVRRCLAKDPADRYQSARELADALAPFEQLAGAVAVPPAPQQTMSGASFATTSPQPTGPMPAAGGTHIPGPPQQTMITGHGPPGMQQHTAVPVGNPATFVGGAMNHAQGNDDSWSIGAQSTETRPPQPSGGSKAPLIVVVIGLLAALAGTAYFMTAKGPRSSGDVAVVPPPTTVTPPATTVGTPDVKTDPTAGTPLTPDTKVGDTASATAGTTPPPDTTAGTTPTPPDTTAGTTPTPPDATAGDDDDGDEKPGQTKLPPPKPDLTLVAQEGSLFAPKAAAPIVASVEEAKAHCATLKKGKFAKLSQWRLGTSGEVLKFKDNKDVQKLAYWVSDPGSAGRAKRVALINGSINEADPKTFTRTRPLCVAKR